MLAANTGIYVERHYYDDVDTVSLRIKLNAELGRCAGIDQSLVSQIHRTGNSVYPLP
jgi:hypothetical protein